MRVSETTGLNERIELLIYESCRKEVPPLIVNCALADRAWACQERVLSPRILHYTTEQLFWEYRHHFHAEEGIQSFNNFNFGSGFTTARGIVWRLMRQNAGSFDRLLGRYNEILHGE
ncbi:hypothetical protein BU25DRAFT_473454 [Macroventuria anomochaeta]|uniref:Uncharacterized protein n=1 Tax=Macroventuria anomochaeta TaxID=301207 RepID=A0ACB6RTZ1_9PLEO|nr:uncharacterized protein BU25DRAFT_473454 [Macroventuria anomochaeta]KAF2625475.1 hypothetical protein BU25DRAFT_473454 [Macroventuria anomochaeta]